ncbi:unnamed protein product [Prorocentrum cordatum]|uniref:Uncharacterized protein n=1 Tax=Prorocentrum cordatum TaxID=2364126 RepID=A0ABN9RYY7_9DINO|nr:unnamed protein product [Polarella glacialis]
MPHVFNDQKGKFEQVHSFKVPQCPSKSVLKRQRNSEYMKFLLASEPVPESGGRGLSTSADLCQASTGPWIRCTLPCKLGGPLPVQLSKFSLSCGACQQKGTAASGRPQARPHGQHWASRRPEVGVPTGRGPGAALGQGRCGWAADPPPRGEDGRPAGRQGAAGVRSPPGPPAASVASAAGRPPRARRAPSGGARRAPACGTGAPGAGRRDGAVSLVERAAQASMPRFAEVWPRQQP